ncbi:14502_t:CDS:2 [Acaulospora morrowiae]|uniref:14502_t:CDS:1 n=1 Tax=Acaulospora morrowiae TaxID=94023 RepID=A0A9N9G2U1_9GLOM|nr:14502_t:CDS:2 [Acaulospora morrowiae]
MQRLDGLAIVYYPPTTSRKRLHFKTWPAQYQMRRRPFLEESLIAQQQLYNTNDQACTSDQSNTDTHQNVDVITPRSEGGRLSASAVLSRPSSSHGERSVAGKDGFSKVPHEIMMNILEHLEPTEIISLSMVNKKLRYHTQDNYLWKQILLNEYGDVSVQEESMQVNTVNTKGKWKKSKSTRKQVSENPDWRKVFMRLSTVNVSTKTAIFKGHPGSFYKYRNFDYKDNDIRDTSNVPPGVYDVIWCMRIEKSSLKPIVIFNTDIWLRHNIYLSSYERESKFYYAPNSDDFTHMIDKGWFNFRLPFKVVIARKEQSVDYRYQVHTAINCYLEDEQNIGKSSSKTKNKGPFSVDSVCLRPHIAYDPIRTSSAFEENYLLPESPLPVEIDSNNHILDESVYSDNEYSEYDAQASINEDVRSCADIGSDEHDKKRWSRGSIGKKDYIKKMLLCSGSPDVYVE